MKKLWAFGALLSISVCAFLVFGKTSAFAADFTWKGGGGSCDNKLKTAACWENDATPTSADTLIFPAGKPNTTITNDFDEPQVFHAIKFTGIATTGGNYSFNEAGDNDITLHAGITSDVTGAEVTQSFNFDVAIYASQSFTTNNVTNYFFSGGVPLGANTLTLAGDGYIAIYGTISGTGNIVKNSGGDLYLSGTSSLFLGILTLNAGFTQVIGTGQGALGSANMPTTINNGATLRFVFVGNDEGCDPVTIAEPFSLAGDGAGNEPYNNVDNYSIGAECFGGPTGKEVDITLSGAISLTADTKVNPTQSFKITGPLSGNFSIGVAQGQAGNLVIASSANTSKTPNGTYQAGAVTSTISNSLPEEDIDIRYHETIVINGVRKIIDVFTGGILKGTGTVGTVSVYNGGKIAPGLSPGCLNTGNLAFETGGIYDFEVGGTTACTQYDQIKVTGTVSLGNGTLNTILYNGFKPVKNQTYTIISNDGTDAVTGTFKDLAEGATFKVNGNVFKISYKGGDGNDVVLTVISVSSPNAGFKLLMNNPAVTLVVTTLAIAGILVIVHRQNKLGARR